MTGVACAPVGGDPTSAQDVASAMPSALKDFAPAVIEREGAPPPRTLAELAAVRAGEKSPADEGLKPLRIVLVACAKDHGVNEHDYPLWQARWAKLLSAADGVEVSTSMDWPTDNDFATADCMLWYSNNPLWSADKDRQLAAYQARGGGLVLLHYAVNGRDAAELFADRVGLAWKPKQSRFRHGPVSLSFHMPAAHPITRGFHRANFIDESYWKLSQASEGVDVLGTGVEEGEPWPLIWAYEQDRSGVFGSILGHYTWTFDDPLFRVLVLRGVSWAAHEPVDRLTGLSTLGARLVD